MPVSEQSLKYVLDKSDGEFSIVKQDQWSPVLNEKKCSFSHGFC